jgi:predicted DNA-binding protein
MTMVRKQVYIEPEQEEKLKRLSKRLGVTEAELIRRAIENYVPSEAKRFFDPQAARELMEFLRKWAESRPNGGGTEKWNRDDAYEERLSRLSR